MNKKLSNVLFWSCFSMCLPQVFISFGVQFAEVYMLQHITVDQKAITTIIGNMVGVIAYWILTMNEVMNFIGRHVKLFVVLEMISFNLAHLIIPEFPWYAMIAMTLNQHLIVKIEEVIFEDLHNAIFRGRDRTILSTKRKMWKMIGMVLGSGLTLLCINLPIEEAIYVSLVGDITLMISHLILYRKLKNY